VLLGHRDPDIEAVESNGDPFSVPAGAVSSGVGVSGRRMPHVVQNFAPARTVDPQFGHRSMGSILLQTALRRRD
jgi:hypothetical protein